MARTIAPHLTPAHLRKMFDSYDENHDGTVSREEVEHALARLELPVTYAAQIFARVDTNGDGLLDFKWRNLKNEHGGKWAIRTWVHGSRNAGVAG